MKELKNMSNDERSLLLFLETRAVDYGGRVNTKHMNKEDFSIAKTWDKEKFISFCRIVLRDVNKDGTHGVKLSEEAWNLAHKERRARFERLWARRNWITTKENIEVNGIAKVRLGI